MQFFLNFLIMQVIISTNEKKLTNFSYIRVLQKKKMKKNMLGGLYK